MPSDTEYELKFRIDPESVGRVLQHPLLREAVEDRRVERLISTYFDTADGLLRANGFALRVREGGPHIVHTLKQTRRSSVARGEWEEVNAARRPDPMWLSRTPLAPLLKDHAATLTPRFTVDVERTALAFNYRGTEIELAIDQGAIRASGRHLSISEVELEVKRGEPSVVWHLARALVGDLPLMLSLSSKSARGYELAEDHVKKPIRKIRPPLRGRMNLAEAFEAIVESCLKAFLKNAALVGTPDDIEGVHRTRVALRHLRAACALLRPYLRRERLAGVETTLKELSRRLGHARDLDVFQQQIFDPLAGRQDVAGARALARLMEADRQRAHGELVASLVSRDTRLAALDLLAFASDGVRRVQRRRKAMPVLRDMLERRRSVLARSAAGLARMSDENMHKVRKSAKMLRYDLDLVRSLGRLGKRKKAKALKRNLTILQDRLGAIHDDQEMRSHVANHVLARFAQDLPVGQPDERKSVSAGVYLCFQKADHARDLKQARRAARRLR